MITAILNEKSEFYSTYRSLFASNTVPLLDFRTYENDAGKTGYLVDMSQLDDATKLRIVMKYPGFDAENSQLAIDADAVSVVQGQAKVDELLFDEPV